MSDEVDDLLRRVLATLDNQVPPGTFETLPDRVQARLDVPPTPLSASPASSMMVTAEHGVASDLPDGEPGPRTRSRRGPMIAGIGLALAAAAGAVIFISVRDQLDGAPALEQELVKAEPPATGIASSAAGSQAPQPAATPAAALSPVLPPVPSDHAAAGSGAAAGNGGVAAPVARAGTVQSGTKGAGAGASADKRNGYAGSIELIEIEDDTSGGGKQGSATKGDAALHRKAPAKPKEAVSTAAPAKPKEAVSAAAPAKPKEAAAAAAPAKPKEAAAAPTSSRPAADPAIATFRNVKKSDLDRTSPSPEEIERGMAPVAARARACFDGPPGRVSVLLSVAPSGQVQQVTVSAPVAGTPVGACVERAVKAATFSPWGGGPHSYRYVISE